MRKTTLFICSLLGFLFVHSQSVPTATNNITDQVIYTIISHDAYGDGWQGNQLFVKQNGTTIATIANENLDGINNNSNTGGEYNTHTVSLVACTSFELAWRRLSGYDAGNGVWVIVNSYPQECSFVVKDNFGEVIFETPVGSINNMYSGCATYPNGTIFNGISNSLVVITQAATDVTHNSALLNKTTNTCDEPIIIEGFKYKAVETQIWENSIDGFLNDLTPNTEYDFYAYAVTETYSMATGDTVKFTTTTDAGIDAMLENFNYSIYPNPANNILNINSEKEIQKITIFTSAGQQILATKSMSINLSTIPNGVYFLKLDFENNASALEKFVKNNK